MKNIEYIETDQQGLDSIGFLWEKLKEHHYARATHHAGLFASMTFEGRKRDFFNKSHNGHLRLDIARDIETGNLVGYCVSSITEKKVGEIESIFIESDYRRHGIGDNFMKKVLTWMDSLSVASKVIGVAAGNEEAFPFYARYGFYPRVSVLQQV
jgi:ribosomal protein S18 acetylase RimI-like enzyme